MLVIRFQRAGRKKSPFYRVVVAEKSRSVKGRFIERVGHYNPLPNPKEVSLKTDRIEYWISVGATPSQTVARLLNTNGVKVAEKFIEKRVMKPAKVEREVAEKAKQKELAKKTSEGEATKPISEMKEEKSKKGEGKEETDSEKGEIHEETQEHRGEDVVEEAPEKSENEPEKSVS